MTELLSFFRKSPEGAMIAAQRIYLRPPRIADHAQWAELRARSEAFLRPWEPAWSDDELTMPAYRRRLRGYWRDARAGAALPLFIFTRDTHVLLGGVNLSNIRRGIAQSASVGYWIGQRHARKGYMTEALSVLTRHAFTRLELHRLEAACIPHNEASRRLLERCGFVHEGLARAYLRINGRWRDHLLFALLREDLEKTKKI